MEEVHFDVPIGLKGIIEDLAEVYHTTFEEMACSLLKEQVDICLSNEAELGQAYAKHLRFQHDFKKKDKPID